ncbi:LLM class flavin-dependent oxidoreductase [Undibacterium sp. RTI2.1]|uniref:LLM class flavin-dependent oxidoreductase n=1 Tax=unclassified Undibacterium TaxID=2630295 RepID=UPI002B23D83E|nr:MULTISPECIES: LLM class flavin-dependent oxidoreductase [unclassified Undibacterium]MEB0032607.1 LLM class flavin-dependent oxidoreductase [Undibacterium sp. RTI2.1]MEB0118580.1 LLM class flavin-dependent oxidoreductase [Undibacterium sp. RTI2.2]
MAKQIRFNAFQINSVGHQSPGLWTHPRDQSHRYTDPEHWISLAQLLERGLFDGLFLADVLGVYDVYQSNADAALRGGVQVPLNDPLALVPLMAHATQHLGFGVTCALTYEHPYSFARRISTLDHLSKGRIAWNIVTGYLDSAARNLGLEHQIGHDARYDIAEEYMEVVYKLWEQSWEDNAVVRDKVNGIFTDPSKVHAIRHHGENYRVPGFHLCEPSPQRTPLLFQAGTSGRGKNFAGKHAECVFVSGPSKAVVKHYVQDLRAATLAAGRNADDILIYAQALIITAASEEEAQAKYADYRSHIDITAALALLSGWTGVDFSKYDPDATIEYMENDAGRSALASFSQADPTRRWTVREAAEFIGLGGRGPVLIGSPQQIADQLIDWVEETGIDGFNLAFAVSHDSMADVVDFIVPELQKRERYRNHYIGGTLRDQLFGTGNRLPENHIGRQIRIQSQESA